MAMWAGSVKMKWRLFEFGVIPTSLEKSYEG